jgi:endonuclease YncB( thermonuclease family)
VHAFFGKETVIRIKGVDTPELRTYNSCEKALAYKGKALIEHTLKNAHRIDLINCERGKYFRIVADVIVDGVSLKDLLIENKLAVEYWGGTKQDIDWCSF